MPLITGKLSYAECKPLIEKIVDRISTWGAKQLTFAGRLQLIQSVLQGITHYWTAHFILPKKVIKQIESKCNSFLWTGDSINCKGAKVSWQTVCLPKKEGGLGLKRLEDWNNTCLARLVWCIFAVTESLWIAWVNRYHLKNESFWTVKIQQGISWTWRKLLRLRDKCRAFIKYQVGNGNKIFMWHDNWHPLGPLLLKFPHRLIYDTASSTQAKLSSVIAGSSWSWPAARSDHAVEVQSFLFDIQPSYEKDDIAIWTPSKTGMFHSGATWYCMRAHSPNVPWYSMVWYKGSTPKCSFIVWLEILNRLSTRDRLAKWFPIDDISCVFCDSPESRDHIFFQCPYSVEIWSKLCLSFSRIVPSSWADMLEWGIRHLNRGRKWMIQIKLAWNYCIYHIWRERNFRIKREQSRSADLLTSLISEELSLKMRSLALKCRE